MSALLSVTMGAIFPDVFDSILSVCFSIATVAEDNGSSSVF